MEKDRNFTTPITSLSGSKISVFLRLTNKYGVEKRYYIRWFNSFLVSCICTIFGWFDVIVYNLKPKPKNLKDPVFIIGHGRSGTTFLHNLMCLDSNVGYTTTYQTVFPNNLFAFQWLFKPIVKLIMPSKRPVDNVKLDVDYPQEEEFALNNEYVFSFYNWWYFPNKFIEITDEYLLAKTAQPKEVKKFKNNYKRLIKRSLMNTKGKRFISKNPPNTARIKWLLEMYPTAKFIFIHRNPYEVVQSTLNFYKSILPPIQLQTINEDKLMEFILYTYSSMLEKYYFDKKLLSSKNLMEIRYKDLIDNPKEIIASIYKDLIQEDFSKIESNITKSIKNNHPLKEYSYEKRYIDRINNSLGWLIKKQGYQLLLLSDSRG
jgi:hypothetical protein